MTRAQQAGRSSRKEIDMISVELTIFVFLWEAVAKRCNDVDRCAHSSRGCAASIGLDRDSCRARYPSLGLAETVRVLERQAGRPCRRELRDRAFETSSRSFMLEPRESVGHYTAIQRSAAVLADAVLRYLRQIDADVPRRA